MISTFIQNNEPGNNIPAGLIWWICEILNHQVEIETISDIMGWNSGSILTILWINSLPQVNLYFAVAHLM